jgi:hypothetical protein
LLKRDVDEASNDEAKNSRSPHTDFSIGLFTDSPQNTNLQPTENIHIDGLLFYEAPRQVATTYRTVIGLVDTEPPPYNKLLNVRMDHATLAEKLDALVKADPRYSWQREPNGVVLVSSRNSHTTLPDLFLNKFDVQNVKSEEISQPSVVSQRSAGGRKHMRVPARRRLSQSAFSRKTGRESPSLRAAKHCENTSTRLF